MVEKRKIENVENLEKKGSDEKDEKDEKEEKDEKDKKQKTGSEFNKGSVLLNLNVPKLDSESEYTNYFNKLADYLLNKVVLVVNDQKFRLTEIEFYYTTEDKTHPGKHVN
jgi:hypothetical protein